MRRSTAFAIALGASVAAADARAQDADELEGSRPGLAFGHPGGEAGLATFAAASNLSYLLPQRTTGWKPYLPSPYDPILSAWSDLTGAVGGSLLQIGIGYALEAAYLDVVGEDLPGVSALRQSAVETEAMLLTSGITAFIKRLAGRRRPRAYAAEEDEICHDCDAFPSGHTSVIAAFSGARVVRLAFTPMNDAFGVRLSAFVVSEAAMVTTGILRVLCGAHSWEDVLAGAIFGHATGALVALAHGNVATGASSEEDTAADAAALRPVDPKPVLFTWGGAF